MKLFKVVFLSILLGLIPAISHASQWSKAYGDTGSFGASAVQQTTDGGFIVAGTATSAETLGEDIWLFKLDKDGNIQWQKTYGGIAHDWANSIQQTIDGGYIVAGTSESFGAGNSDVWILKLDQNGIVQWQKTYGGSGGEGANMVQQTTDGGYIVGAVTSSFGAGNSDAWILKLDANGDVQWQKTIGSSAKGESANAVRQTPDGGYIVAGDIQTVFSLFSAAESGRSSMAAVNDGVLVIKLDTNGNKQWQKSYGPSIGSIIDIQITPDGGYILIGTTLSSGSGYSNILILKLNANGDIQWQKAYDSTGSDGVGSIQLTSDGGYILAGITNIALSSVAVIAKIDAGGNIIWWKNYGTGRSGISSIQKTSDGDYIAAGGIFTVSSEVSWILKIDNNGDIPDCQITAPPTPIKIINMSLTAASDDMIVQNTAVSPITTSATVKDSSMISTGLCVAGTMAAPTGWSFFVFSPTYFPSLDANPVTARPVGVGSILSPSFPTLSVQIGLLTFTSPVDVYGAYTLSTNPGIINVLNPDLTFQSFSFSEIAQAISRGTPPTGVVPWKSNTAGPIKEALLGDIPASSLPKGTYTVYLLVTPTGRFDSYYLWKTSFIAP